MGFHDGIAVGVNQQEIAKMDNDDSTPIHTRLPVGLRAEDNRLLIELQSILQKNTGKRLSWSAIIRICIRTQAALEGIECK